MFWSVKNVFVCMCVLFPFIIVPSILDPFSDLYLYMRGVQILCDLFIQCTFSNDN